MPMDQHSFFLGIVTEMIQHYQEKGALNFHEHSCLELLAATVSVIIVNEILQSNL